jgi:hypothetical protein
MIDVIRQQLRDDMPVDQRVLLVREFMQILTLKILGDRGIFKQLAFIGGTALRIIYRVRRFSEDLDFSATRTEGFDISSLNTALVRQFALYGLEMEGKPRINGNVHGLMMKFPGILRKLELDPMVSRKVQIKLEVDLNPPAGWCLANTALTETFICNVVHYDLPSLFAGKIHALCYRQYTKGRDIYDLYWYLGQRIVPNWVLLNNAIYQTQGTHLHLDAGSFKKFLLERIERMDIDAARKDVERFLVDKSELALFDRKVLRGTIETRL